MDENKLKVLREIRYRITPHCGICQHADLSADGWGYCNAHTYEHLKHSETESRLSVHQMGSCGSFIRDGGKVAIMGLAGFWEFVSA